MPSDDVTLAPHAQEAVAPDGLETRTAHVQEAIAPNVANATAEEALPHAQNVANATAEEALPHAQPRRPCPAPSRGGIAPHTMVLEGISDSSAGLERPGFIFLEGLDAVAGAQMATAPCGQGARKRRRCDSGWVPGWNVDGWIGRGGRPVTPQAQVLIANAVRQLDRVPLLHRAQYKAQFPAVGNTSGCDQFAVKVASGILRVRAKTVRNIWAHIRKHGPSMRPKLKPKAAMAKREAALAEPPREPSRLPEEALPPSEALPPPAEEALPPSPEALPLAQKRELPAGAMNLVRTCAFLSSKGMPKDNLPGLVHLIVEAKGDVHSSYHTRKFATEYERVAHGIAVADLARALMEPLPGTGRPPDLEFICDHASIGKYFARSRDTIFFMGFQFSIKMAPYTACILIGTVNEAGDGRCEAQIKHIKDLPGFLPIRPLLSVSLHYQPHSSFLVSTHRPQLDFFVLCTARPYNSIAPQAPHLGPPCCSL